MTKKDAFLAIFHLLVAGHFWFACFYDWTYIHLPVECYPKSEVSLWGTQKFKYLTYWTCVLQSVFFTVCFLNDVFGTNETLPVKTPCIRRFKDAMFAGLSFPMGALVSSFFWALYLKDRDLILPKYLDAYYPSWLNTIQHIDCSIFVFLELFTCYKIYPTHKKGLTIASTYLVAYMIWSHIFYFMEGFWVYPVIDQQKTWFGVYAVMFPSYVLAMLFYFIGEMLNYIIWRRSLAKETGPGTGPGRVCRSFSGLGVAASRSGSPLKSDSKSPLKTHSGLQLKPRPGSKTDICRANLLYGSANDIGALCKANLAERKI